MTHNDQNQRNHRHHENNSGGLTPPTIRIVRLSSREQVDLLPEKLAEFQRCNIPYLFDETAPDPDWAYVAAPVTTRAQWFTTALLENESSVVLCARGGYGASDILPLIPWEKLRLQKPKPKLVVGFSDTSALHSALWTQLGWQGLHGPMPATTLWPAGAIENPALSPDVTRLLDFLAGKTDTGSLPLTAATSGHNDQPNISGTLFGGCFSVLTNLIGTPYLPQNFVDHILFFEDIGEHPARLTRFWNQWLQADLLRGVRAVIWGSLTQMGQNIPDNPEFLIRQLAARCPDIPMFTSTGFGHVAPNWPLGVGARAVIAANGTENHRNSPELKWGFGSDKFNLKSNNSSNSNRGAIS